MIPLPLFVELLTIPQKKENVQLAQPKCAWHFRLGMMCLGMACLYAPRIMDRGALCLENENVTFLLGS
jgi:hypothetical protein